MNPVWMVRCSSCCALPRWLFIGEQVFNPVPPPPPLEARCLFAGLFLHTFRQPLPALLASRLTMASCHSRDRVVLFQLKVWHCAVQILLRLPQCVGVWEHVCLVCL